MKLTNKINIVLCLIAIVTFLNGCAAVVAGSAATAYVTDPRSSKQISGDRNLKSEAKTALDKALPKNNIETSSYNNAVLLTGQVASQSDSDIATKTVQGIPNVRKVYNYIEVRDFDSSSYSNDAYITSKVKAEAFTTIGIDSNNIKVITNNSSVYILGATTKSQAERLVNIAKSVSGVKKVTLLVDYI